MYRLVIQIQMGTTHVLNALPSSGERYATGEQAAAEEGRGWTQMGNVTCIQGHTLQATTPIPPLPPGGSQ
jgi:hypothetical protein